jgi:hypothetical protein
MSPATSTIASVSSTGKLTVAGVIATMSVATTRMLALSRKTRW